MTLIADFRFNDTDGYAADSAPAGGDQLGFYMNGATASGGQAILDGVNDLVKIFRDPVYQLPRGTLEIQFTQATASTGPATILSRDSVGTTEGAYRAEIMPDGSIVVTHETATGAVTFQTAAGFVTPGDEVRLTYAWDATGPGALNIVNLTSTATYSAAVPAGLTMDMGDLNQQWMVGAGQSQTNPFELNDLNNFFHGSVEYFQISDSVDLPPPPAERDGIVRGTTGDDLIDSRYIDTDGDRIDANDAIIPGDAPNVDRVVAGDGNDTVFSGIGNDMVDAGAGDDSVDAGDGDDLITGGDGNDTLRGRAGDDTIYGGDGSDAAYGGNGNDMIDTRGPNALPDRDYPGLYPADSDPMNDRDTVYGGAGDDTIYTGDDNDLIYGGDGNDFIDAGIDDDTVYGWADNDTITAGEGRDLVYGGGGDDVIYGGLGPSAPDAINIPDATDLRPDNGMDTLYGGAGNDTIYGMDDRDELYGDRGDDVLDGGIDDDTLFGGAGNDTLIGGQGADVMSGGADRDLFLVTGTDGIGDVIDGNESGDDYDTLDLTGAGPLRVTYDPDNAENGRVDFLDRDGNISGSLTFRNIENVIPCFTPGTLIATPKGEVPVERLRVGDRVITRDNGIQEIRWVGRKDLMAEDFEAQAELKPVMIRAGSLGNGLPERDMLVSPQHRLLIANDRTQLYFDEHEVLVAAKHLVGKPGIRQVMVDETAYIHFMFDRHEVVLSDGAWTESFQPGDYTMKGMGADQRAEIFSLFPELADGTPTEAWSAARRTLKKHEALLLR